MRALLANRTWFPTPETVSPAPTPIPPPPPPPPTGGGGGDTAGTLQAALRASMQKPPGREGRVLQSFWEPFTQNYPEFTTTAASNYTVQTFKGGLYGANETQWQPWLVMWEEATRPYGQPHVANISNRKVATRVKDWYCGIHYSDTDEWVITGPVQYTDVPDMFDGRIAAFQGAGKFPTSQRVVYPDGTSGAILVNDSGITQATQVRCQHSWWTKDDGTRGMVQIDASRYWAMDAVFTAIKARVDPVTTALSGASIGGTAADVAASRILMWTGTDYYPKTYSKPDDHATMAGRPVILTGDFKWHCSWVKQGSPDQSWLDAHPVPYIV
jgi:hypothetical protein